MLYKQQLLQAIWQQIYRFLQFPYCSLLAWMLPLLLCSSGESSLIAHDEALYTWRARQMFDSGDWVAPWGHAHHKTPGIYWLIAIAYKLFGVSETSARLPSMIAGIFSLLILYEIGTILLGKKVAWLAAAILSLEFLWLQSCRLASPDVPMIFLVLLAIYSFLKAELHPKYCSLWIFLAGLSFGLGFLVRSFMIFLPMMALLPYLIWEHRRHRHLANPMFYLGLAIGLIPTLIWLWLSWWRYGNLSFRELFQFVLNLGSENRNHNGIIFYLWNVPLKSFPWFIFSLVGLVLTIYRPIERYQLILVGFPLLLFAELSIFSTRLSHYALCLYPFIALLAAVSLQWLGRIYNLAFIQRKILFSLPQKIDQKQILSSLKISLKQHLVQDISYGFGLLALVILVISIVGLNSLDTYINKYATLTLILGLGWLSLPLVWIAHYYFGQKFLTSGYWLASLLIPCWLTLAVAGISGFFSDYNPDFRVFFQQPAIASILSTHPVSFVQVDDKNSVLLRFYTPVHGQQVDTISQLPVFSYAWIHTPRTTALSTPYRVIGTLHNYQLIQVLPEVSR